MTPSLFVSGWTIAAGPDLLAAVALGVYVTVARRLRDWPRLRTLSFSAGLGAILVALQSGVAAYDDRLLSAHMVQHMLLLMVAPPLLLAAQPVLLALRTLPARRRPRVARALRRARRFTGPAPALGAFYLITGLTHLSAFYNTALAHPLVHDIEHLLYLGAGLLVWWPILDADPVAARRLGGLGRLGYVLAAMPPTALLGAYLDRAPSLVYPAYAGPARALGISALEDQAQAGAIMWVAGGVIMTVAGLSAAVGALLAEERRQQAREARAVQA